VLDLHLLRHREGAADRSRVDEDAIVYEERGWPLALPLAPVGAENLDLQWVLPSGRFTIARILVYQPLGVKAREAELAQRSIRVGRF
jgi:hypothetical protein